MRFTEQELEHIKDDMFDNQRNDDHTGGTIWLLFVLFLIVAAFMGW